MRGLRKEDLEWLAQIVEPEDSSSDWEIGKLIAESAIKQVGENGTEGLRALAKSLEEDSQHLILSDMVAYFAQRLSTKTGIPVEATCLGDVSFGVIDEIDHYCALSNPEQEAYRARLIPQT